MRWLHVGPESPRQDSCRVAFPRCRPFFTGRAVLFRPCWRRQATVTLNLTVPQWQFVWYGRQAMGIKADEEMWQHKAMQVGLDGRLVCMPHWLSFHVMLIYHVYATVLVWRGLPLRTTTPSHPWPVVSSFRQPPVPTTLRDAPNARQFSVPLADSLRCIPPR